MKPVFCNALGVDDGKSAHDCVARLVMCDVASVELDSLRPRSAGMRDIMRDKSRICVLQISNGSTTQRCVRDSQDHIAEKSCESQPHASLKFSQAQPPPQGPGLHTVADQALQIARRS